MHQWLVTLRFDGTPNPEHGPVSPIADGRVKGTSAMICGNWPDGYSTFTYVADFEDRADAVLAVLEEANRYAAEVGLPGNPEVHAAPAHSAAPAATC